MTDSREEPLVFESMNFRLISLLMVHILNWFLDVSRSIYVYGFVMFCWVVESSNYDRYDIPVLLLKGARWKVFRNWICSPEMQEKPSPICINMDDRVGPQNGCFIMENPIKMDDLRGTIIFWNTHMLIYSKFTSFFKGDPLIPQMEVT